MFKKCYHNLTSSAKLVRQLGQHLINLINHCHEDVWGSESIAPHILNLGTRWRWVVIFMPQPLYPWGKSPWYPLDRKLGGLGASLDMVVERKIPSLPLLGIKPWSSSS